jgi:hypothetical protein
MAAYQAIGCVVRKVGGCHRVRSTGTLKTRNLSPLTQSIVGHGHPFWEHQVATDLVGLNNLGQAIEFIVPVDISEIGRS